MTFEQFQATRTWSDDIAQSIKSADWNDAPMQGQVYDGGLYIEAAHGIEGATGDYVLTIGNVQKFGELEDLERDLYNFAKNEGYFD